MAVVLPPAVLAPCMWMACRNGSCVLPVDALTEEEKITTIEGLSPDGSHPVQQAWAELDVPQCGYCQTGMIYGGGGVG